MKTTEQVDFTEITAYEAFEMERLKESWTLISENENVQWTTEFIDDNKENLDWKAFSFNNSLPWSPEFIRQYESYWDWHALSYILADKYSLSGADLDNLLIQYKEKIDWKVICQGTSIKEHHLTSFSDVIDWDALSSNNSFDWLEPIINVYMDKINWKLFSECMSTKLLRTNSPRDLSGGKYFRRNAIELYEHKLDFGILSSNDSLNLTPDIIDKYKDRWNWAELINNPAIRWNELMLKKHNKYISTIPIEELRVSDMWTSLIERNTIILRDELIVNYKLHYNNHFDNEIAALVAKL